MSTGRWRASKSSGATGPPAQQRPLLRRLVIFSAMLGVLSLSGLGLLLFRWWGDRGAPPASRLYVQGDFEGQDRLAVLERDLTSDSVCFRLEVDGAPAQPGKHRVCRGRPLRVWVEDALLDLSIGARGVPRVSIAGLRAREGDLIGSLAGGAAPAELSGSSRGERPRFPLRAHGVPGRAGRVVACRSPAPNVPASGLCLEVYDRLGRLAIVRSSDGERPGSVQVPEPGDRVRLANGDVLWLGLVAFEVRWQRGGEGSDRQDALILDRIDRLRPRRGAGVAKARDFGGDRRWLGRLWHVEAPDPSAEVQPRFEIFPARQRYTPHHLSRQRTNLEGEDVLQRLIDGGWLCLERNGETRITWRPLERPGCGEEPPQIGSGLTRSQIDDYRRARFGDLAYLGGSLVNAANAVLTSDGPLEDATLLPFVFDWRLSQDAARSAVGERRVPQPVPHRLWGVRFGTTRQVRRLPDTGWSLPPTVLPRSSTARHVLQVLRKDELLASFYFPASDSSDSTAPQHGVVCLGKHQETEDSVPLMTLRPTSGAHHPLGSVAFVDDPQAGSWSPDLVTQCEGCRLSFELRPGDAELRVTASGSCESLKLPSGGAAESASLAHDKDLSWGDLRLRHVERGDGPWLAASDPGTGRRHFAEEFYLHGRLRPLLGDAAGLSGVEAALRELLEDSGSVGVAPGLESLELTIDGDLQLSASAIVDALARPQIAADDPEPHQVSVTAAILDARSGDLLAAVNWASATPVQTAASGSWSEPTAWELGSGQADVLENAALLRRGAIGSTMKIAGSYALLNNDGLRDGAEITQRQGFLEAPLDRGQLYLQRGGSRASRRRCSTGPHVLPRNNAGFTTETFVRRFATSCNNFFVLTGFRHLSSRPASLGSPSRWPEAGAGPSQLLIDRRQRGRPTLVGPAPAVQTLAERIRDGLAEDFAPGSLRPRSLYGILFPLGFQPRPGLFRGQGEAPGELSFDHRGQSVDVPLVKGWFSPGGEDAIATPALQPGRDFSYPGVPSPGRLDEAAARGRTVIERYDGTPREVTRFAEGRADVQWSMLMIGQSSVEASAIGLASLYAPAARGDGRAVSPCLFRANCGAGRAGVQIIDPEGALAGVLDQALSAVLRDGTARGGLWRLGRRGLARRGWGGKTGTYQVERSRWVGMSTEQWRQLRAWACGVEGVDRPRIGSGGRRVSELGVQLSRAPSGSALGSRVCEDVRLPLNPAGVHAYRGGKFPSRLDELAAELERTAETDTRIYHSFVTLLPARADGVDSPAEGVVVAVLVDRQTKDKSVAIQIGGELAAAVERWAGALEARSLIDGSTETSD